MTWPSDWQTNVTFLLRWGHFLAGITWIGMLYFFNLVNVNFMKELDAATKGKVVPNLMPKALWWFRWGAFWTVLTGLVYYMLILHTEANVGRTLAVVLIGWIVAWLVVAALLRMSVAGGPLKDGRVLGVVIGVLVAATAYGVASLIRDGGSNRSIAIGIGGGLGTVMFMNVWMIIWPLQKKIIAATKAAAEGTPTPAEMPMWARRAFLASRTNTWLSLPMLFFMGAASHFPIFARLGGG